MRQSGVSRTGPPAVAPPPPPRPLFLPRVHQSVHDVFVRLETRVGHVYNRREEDVEQEGCEYGPLPKALFYSERPRAHSIVESHACSQAIVELVNDRYHILRHAKTASTAQRRVRSTESYALLRSIKQTYNGICFFRANSCNRRSTKNVI